MRISKTLVLVALAALACQPPLATADDVSGAAVGVDGDKPVVEKLLDIMLASGQISRSDYDALLQQARDEQAAAAASASQVQTAAVSEAPPSWDFKWNNGFKLERSDGRFKLGFGGRLMLDGSFIWQEDQLNNAFGRLDIDPKEGSGWEFRRARIFFDGTVYDRLFFKAQYDFAEQDDEDGPDFKDLFVGLKKLGPVSSVRIGHFKEPMMLNEVTSSKYITFMERAPNAAFFPGRDVGLELTGNALSKRLLWNLGGFRKTNDVAFAFDEWGEGDYDVAARLVGVPLWSDDGSKVVHLGASYIHQFRDSETGSLRYRARPSNHLAQRYVNTDSFDADDSDLLNLELAGVWGRLSAQAEYTNSWVQGGPGQADTNFWGVYAYLSYFLTGESRKYDLGKGRFGRIKPKANFNPAKGDWGAWEIAARYSYLDLTSKNITGGNLWDVTVGLNWYLFPNTRLMWNYVHGDVRDRITTEAVDDADVTSAVNGAGDMFQMRFQVDF